MDHVSWKSLICNFIMYVPICETRLDSCIAIEAQSDRTDRVEKHRKAKGETLHVFLILTERYLYSKRREVHILYKDIKTRS